MKIKLEENLPEDHFGSLPTRRRLGNDVRHPSSSTTAFDFLEGWLGGLLAILFAFELIVAMALIVADMPSATFHVPRSISIPLLLVVGIFNAWLIPSIWTCLTRKRLPLGPCVAESQPSVPALLRPLVAAVWLTHAGVLIYAGYRMQAVPKGISKSLLLEDRIGLFLIAWAMTFLGNIYVVLTMHAFSPTSSLQRIFWQWRVMIDLLLALGTSLAPFAFLS